MKTELVEYHDGQTLLEGYVAYPSGEGKHPGVMVVHEWWGHNNYVRKRAEMLAELGYIGFAVDMFGQGVQAKTPDQAGPLYGAVMNDRHITRRRIQAALETFCKNPALDPTQIACIGYCMGGTVSLELARAGAELKGVVSFHGALNTTLPAKRGAIRCPVLVLHGAEDPMIPPEHVQKFREEMRAAQADWQFHEYSNAVHAFTNPNANMPELGILHNPLADRRSWIELRQFLKEIFAE